MVSSAAQPLAPKWVPGAVMEGILYQSIIRQNPDLKTIASKTQQITEAIATIWYRTVFLEAPPAAHTKLKLFTP